LTLKSDEPLSNVAFKFKLRRYNWVLALMLPKIVIAELKSGRGLHSSTFRLNVSTFCGIRQVHDVPPVY